MGAHFRSIQVKSENRDTVIAAVKSLLPAKDGRALIGPVINGWIGIYANDPTAAESFTSNLATHLKTHVLDLVVHDSDIFFYNYYRDGQLIDEYSSCPDYFEDVSAAEHQRLKGKPEVFRDLIGSDKKLAELEALLKTPHDTEEFLFEEHRLEKFANLFGIANTFAWYEYLMDGEWDGIEGRKEFIHIPDLTAEKNAARAAAAALRAEKNRLKKQGLLCFEALPPKDVRFSIGQMALEPLNGGIVFNWSRYIHNASEPRLFQIKSPWTSELESIEVPASSRAMPTDLVFSKTGKWFACSDGDLRLWHWPERKLSEKTIPGCWPIQFSADEERLLCRTQRRFAILSLETWSVTQTVVSGNPSPHFLAWHPAGRYLVIRHAQEQIGLIDLEAGKLIKVLYFGTIVDWSELVAARLRQLGVSEERLVGMDQHDIRGSDQPFSCKFSPDGRLLFCATTRGLRVLEWDKVLAAEKTTPPPLFAASPMPLESPMEPTDQGHYISYIYDVVLDEQQNRLLFCGIEGAVRYFNLKDGSTGILFKPPGDDYIWHLQLSADREFICCLFTPSAENRKKKPGRIQVWNYRLLRTAAGLD